MSSRRSPRPAASYDVDENDKTNKTSQQAPSIDEQPDLGQESERKLERRLAQYPRIDEHVRLKDGTVAKIRQYFISGGKTYAKVVLFKFLVSTALGAAGAEIHEQAVAVTRKQPEVPVSMFVRDERTGFWVTYEVEYFAPNNLDGAIAWATDPEALQPRLFYQWVWMDSSRTRSVGFCDVPVARDIPDDFLDSEPKPDQEEPILRALDLFAGCGGLSFGFHQANIDSKVAIEFSAAAVDHFKSNHPSSCEVLQGDIASIKVGMQMLIKKYASDESKEKYKQFWDPQQRWLPGMDRSDEDIIPERVIKVHPPKADSNLLVAEIIRAGSDAPEEDRRVLVDAAQISYSGAFADWKKENPDEWYEIKMKLKNPHSATSQGSDDSNESVEDADDGEDISIVEDFEIGKIIDFRALPKEDIVFFQFEAGASGATELVPLHRVTDRPDIIREFVESKIPDWPLPGNIDVICGGPPCQDFSWMNGNRNTRLTWFGRNRLVQEWLDWVRLVQPKFAVMENVPGMLDFEVPQYVIAQLITWGYQCRLSIIDAFCYGIPQTRRRVIIIAAKSGEYLPALPPATHYAERMGQKKRKPPPRWANALIPAIKPRIIKGEDGKEEKVLPNCIKKCPNIRDAIGDLPDIPQKQTGDLFSYACAPKNEYQQSMRTNCTNDPTFAAVMNHSVDKRLGSLTSVRGRDLFRTILTHSSAGGHYLYKRKLTVRELARGHSFPDAFNFFRNTADAMHVIGNSVPPLLAFVIGQSIMKAFCQKRNIEWKDREFHTRPWEIPMRVASDDYKSIEPIVYEIPLDDEDYANEDSDGDQSDSDNNSESSSSVSSLSSDSSILSSLSGDDKLANRTRRGRQKLKSRKSRRHMNSNAKEEIVISSGDDDEDDDDSGSNRRQSKELEESSEDEESDEEDEIGQVDESSPVQNGGDDESVAVVYVGHKRRKRQSDSASSDDDGDDQSEQHEFPNKKQKLREFSQESSEDSYYSALSHQSEDEVSDKMDDSSL